MGVSHLSPTGTRNRFEEIIDYKGNHVDLVELSHDDPHLDRIEEERREQKIIDHFTENYRFRERSEWLNDNQKIAAATHHGVELRILYHPSGTTKYYYLVVTSGEFNSENLAMQHLPSYYDDLKKELKETYGNLRRKTSAWTSEEVEEV